MSSPTPIPISSWLPLVLVSICIVTANGCLIVAFVKGKKQLLQASSGVLLCNQAASDLLNGVLFLPTIAVERIKRHAPVSPFVICYIFYVSLFSLCLLALDRFLSIVRPIHHRIYFRETSLFKLVAMVWLLPLVLALIPLIWWFKPGPDQHDPSLIYFGILWTIMCLFSIVMIGLYIATFNRVKRILSDRHEDNTTDLMASGRTVAMTKRLARKELRLTKLFCSLLLVFILSYTPVVVVNLLILTGKNEWVPSSLTEFSLYTFVSSSLVNPVLCIWMQTKLREQLIALITCKPAHRVPRRNSSSTVTYVSHRKKSGLMEENGNTETGA